MSEYATEDFLIYAYDEEKDELYQYTLEELLPEGFSF
jgi:cytidine deaminase